MRNFLKRIFLKTTLIQDEEQNLIRFVTSLDISPDQIILDVGCGYGRNLNLLQSKGLKVIGVDINSVILEANLQANLPCMTVEHFNQTDEEYDVILMSHVIEHLQPNDLLKFMDTYLDRLKLGGYLIIVTPLHSPYFYDDFDHVKPYHPIGIEMVFGGHNDQVQYYSRHRLKLQDIWFRRNPFKLRFFAGLHVKEYSKLPLIVNFLSVLLFRLSFRLIGRTDGWIGLYQKIE